MKNFLVEISWNGPYPMSDKLRVSGTSLATGVGRALRQWKKSHKGNRTKEMTIEVTRL